MYLEDANTAVK